MNNNLAEENEKKNRKKGMFISFFLHGSLLMLAVFPFLNIGEAAPSEESPVITVDFVDFSSASAQAAPSMASGGKVQQKKAVEKPKKIKPLEPKKPVVTTPEQNPRIKTAPVKKTKKPKPAPKPTPEKEVKSDSKKETPSTETPQPEPDENSAASDKSGKPGDTDGKGDTPSKADGKGKDMTPGEGDEGMDFSGDGIFGRRVVRRADVKSLTELEGKIVINLCVDQAGKVVYAKYNPEFSTISRRDLVSRAELCTKRYRFDKDYTAPSKQCGKLTYIFELD